MSTGVSMLVLWLSALCLKAHLAVGSETPASCASDEDLLEPRAEKGGCLLQTVKKHGKASTSRASDVLPDPLKLLGVEAFGSMDNLDQVVEGSQSKEIEYAGVKLQLRFREKDNAAWRLGQKSEDGYDGLSELEKLRKNKDDMVTMIDMGGNNGLVTIAVYKKYPDMVRAVITEPISATYFFMRWNMHLNKVPYLTKEEFTKDRKKPGVSAVHAGVTESGQDLHMCSHPEWSMNAIAEEQGHGGIWDFRHKANEGSCECGPGFDCTVVPGVTTRSLFDDYFGEETITLLKMDCEGCEYYALPALMEFPKRLTRLVGELHMPEERFIDMSCKYDSGQYLTKVCRTGEAEWKSSLPLECGKSRPTCKW